jgi:hypothetical protein
MTDAALIMSQIGILMFPSVLYNWFFGVLFFIFILLAVISIQK